MTHLVTLALLAPHCWAFVTPDAALGVRIRQRGHHAIGRTRDRQRLPVVEAPDGSLVMYAPDGGCFTFNRATGRRRVVLGAYHADCAAPGVGVAFRATREGRACRTPRRRVEDP